MKKELNVVVHHEADASTVALSGYFDYGTTNAFGKAMRECIGKPVREVIVDLDGIEYIDSMAMGSLLVYREKLSAEGKQMVLARCKGPVRDAMNLANFQKIFQIR